MKYSIKFSAQAGRDLDRTWDEVLETSKSLAVTTKYIDDLLDKIESKSEFPLSGSPLYYEELFTGYRFITFKAYLVFYHVEGKEILVDRILYGKSDYIRRLKLKEQE